jgi:hypothetical protein
MAVNRDVFTDDFSLSVMTDHQLQYNKYLDNFGLSSSQTLNLNLDVSSKPSTSSFNTGHSSSESNQHFVSPV